MSYYIPNGRITAHQALDHLMRLHHPDLVESFPKLVAEEKAVEALKIRARPEPIRPIQRGSLGQHSSAKPSQPLSSDDRKRIAIVVEQRKQLETICDQEVLRMRRGLAEGEIAATFTKENGKEYPVDIYYWRTGEGFQSLKWGNYRNHHAMSGYTDEGLILLLRSEFENWANPSNQPAPKSLSTEGTARVLGNQGTAPRNKRGSPPKKADAIEAKMLEHYAGRPESLAGEKQITLQARYPVADKKVSFQTIERARKPALKKLRQMIGETSTKHQTSTS